MILVNFADAPIQPYTVESARAAIFDATSAFFLELAHELGHGHALWHSHALDCGATAVIRSSCVTNEYGEIVDVMGAGEPAHFNEANFERECGEYSGRSNGSSVLSVVAP